MDTDLPAYRPAPHKTGLNCVRAKAQRQSKVTFKRESVASQSTSYQQLQSLKSISAVAEEERDRELAAEPSWLAKMWGMFQQAIGNR